IKLVLSRAKVDPADATMIGDTPYDAQAAGQASAAAIGVMSGGFTEAELGASGCAAVYADPSALLKIYDMRTALTVPCAILLLMTPAALHRIAFKGQDVEAFLRLGSGFVLTAAFL